LRTSGGMRKAVGAKVRFQDWEISQEQLESRILGNSSVRFGGGVTETWTGNRLRRWVPTQPLLRSLRASPQEFAHKEREEAWWARCGTGGIICGKWTPPITFSSMQSSAVSTESLICVSNQQQCQSGVKSWTCQSSGCGSPHIGWKKSSAQGVII